MFMYFMRDPRNPLAWAAFLGIDFYCVHRPYHEISPESGLKVQLHA